MLCPGMTTSAPKPMKNIMSIDGVPSGSYRTFSPNGLSCLGCVLTSVASLEEVAPGDDRPNLEISSLLRSFSSFVPSITASLRTGDLCGPRESWKDETGESSR